MFCYAYYVTPPPTSGTIVIRKQVDVDPPQFYTQDFGCVSNITYNASGDFVLAVTNNAAASMTFIRAETTTGTIAPWEVTELVPDGWQLQSLTCHQLRLGTSSDLRRRGDVRDLSGAPVTLSPAPTSTSATSADRCDREAARWARQARSRSSAGLTGRKPMRHVITTTAPRHPESWTTPFTTAGTYRIAEV